MDIKLPRAIWFRQGPVRKDASVANSEGAIAVLPVRRFQRRRLAGLTIRPDQDRFLPSMRRVLNRFRSKANAFEYAIYKGARPVGYFQINLSERETAYYADGAGIAGLEAMCVDQHWQSRGIAASALGELQGIMERFHPDVRQINLTVDCENAAAIKAYSRAGFVHTGRTLHLDGQKPQYVLAQRMQRETIQQTEGVSTHAA